MFYINKDTVLDSALLQKILNKFNLSVLPQLQKWENYYKGKHIILNKTYADTSKECNHIVTNYCKIVTDTYSGYICGKPVSYTSNNDIAPIQEVINYNDDNSENINWCSNALIYSVGYELAWLDKYAQIRYSQVNPLTAFPIYDNTLDCELLYFVRWYKADNFDDTDLHYVEVYDMNTVKIYKAHGLLSSLEFVEEKPHYFGDVPVSVFWLNENQENIFNSIISLNDAYNELQSSEIDDFNAWVDAYLALIGVDAEAEDILAMKENRVLLLPEGASASWLVKNASDTQINNMLDNIRKNIFKVTAAPDMTDDNFMAQSGTALAYKLVGFENVASGIVARFTKAIQRRIELICNILQIKATDAIWRDVNINFVRNLPVNITETIQLINALKGTVSDKTLLGQLPFIDDVDGELEAVEAQKQANLAAYSFAPVAEDEEDTAA